MSESQDIYRAFGSAWPKWAPRGFVVVDVETTGLEPGVHSVVEIGAVTPAGDGIEIKCLPEDPHWRERCQTGALACNGYTISEISENVVPESEGVQRLFEWLGCRYGWRRLLLGNKNPQFDYRFLAEIAGRIEGLDIEKRIGRRPVDLHSVVYHEAWRRFGDAVEGESIDVLYERLNLPAEAVPHRSLQGARCAMECFRKLWEDVGDEHG